MGAGVGPAKVVELRRAFRRLEPEKMFRAPRVGGEPIWAYWKGAPGEGGVQNQMPLPLGKRASSEEGFVMVPAKELAEVRALEGTLRHERSVLNAHCLIAFKEGEVHCRTTRMVENSPAIDFESTMIVALKAAPTIKKKP